MSSELKNSSLDAKLMQLSDVVFDAWRLAHRSYPLPPKPLQCRFRVSRLVACLTTARTIFHRVAYVCELVDPWKFIISDLRLLHFAAKLSRC